MTSLWQQSQERETKKMTTQHKDCFCLYTNPTKFIKSCFTYLKDPNQFLKTEHFKMEGLRLLPDRHGAITQCNGQSLLLTPHISITMYWTDFYQIYIFYALHIYDFTYQI